MTINTVIKTVEASMKIGGKLVVKHLPTILTAVGTVGVIFGTVKAIKKAPEAHVEFQEVKDQKDELDKADYVWKLVKIGTRYYGIVCLVIGGSIVCFWVANHINLMRLGAALGMAKVSSDYAKDLENQIKKDGGDKALTKVKDEINAEKIRENPIPFDASKLDHMIGETPVWEPVSRAWYITTAHKILHGVDMVRMDLASQLRDGLTYAFVPIRDFLDYAEMNVPGPYSEVDSTNYLGFAVECTDINNLRPDRISELVEEACSVDFTSEIKDGMVGALGIKWREPPKYRFDWE